MEERRTYHCEYCNETIDADIIRMDAGKIFHLDCFERFINPNIKEQKVFACPKCRTTGKCWSTTIKKWKSCKLCFGTGYIYEDMNK